MSAVAAVAAVVVPAPRPSVDDVDTIAVLPVLFVPEASQWLSTSAGRIAGEGYSWMQAVHWVAGSGLYKPRRRRSHGPRSFGPTTVRVAQELAQLFPCRPGIEYLVRRTGLSERSVEYHLGMLREAGLLAWIVKGTRVSGGPALASEFARMIPVEFDVALGIRTVQRDEDAPAYTRAVSGIAEAGRELMARLAQKASRKVRKPRSKAPAKASVRGAEQGDVTAVSDEVRCTPMQVGTSASSTAGDTSFPPESKLASGKRKSPTLKKSKAKTGERRKLNCIGRRFQLAGELICRVPWLAKAARPRIAWIVREVADAGWTADEVIAWLDLEDAPKRVLRPSGFLAQRLDGAVRLWPTAEGRARAVEAYRASRRAEQARHAEWEGSGAPSSQFAARLFCEAAAQVRQHDQPPAQLLYTLTTDDVPAAPPELSEHELIDMRAAAQKDPSLVTSIAAAYGEDYARYVFTADIADLVQRVRGTGHLAIDRPWEEYA
ncbi:transcriptional regulator [Streptomyces sp. NEAU-W12]|uniref:transcriptional regulator n=1 Tax=Streptomyces sp. NEAU-W12 TaxID=2994668 RepID=UPI00224AFF80|nr:transcriptional regulator [Streptomyces sp. NEAU-W12]MCX2927914.1 transcriptional regulator [Streptomyces sp. NEAU-W12]